MRHDLLVDFETFYYFNLLDKIRNLGGGAFDGSERDYLEHFLDYLSDADNAIGSIEKLIEFKSTSDLSIFFSDMLEHLNRIDPDKAMEEVNSYAKDFLEMFGVLNKDSEWQSYLESVTGLKITPEPDVMEDLSFDEYCDYVINSKINTHAQRLPPNQQSLFKDFLQTVSKTPSLASDLQQRIQNPNASEFIDISNSLFIDREDTGNIHDYIQNFQSRVDRWSMSFEKILREGPEDLKAMLYTERAEEIQEPSERTEELFEKVKEEAFEKEEEFATPGDDVDELVDRMGQAKHRAEDDALSEEETERRKLLQDYILSEIDFYKEELYSLLQKLSDGNHDVQSENKLLENLKFLKDLGQIHSYLGIEFVGKNLLKLFEGVFRNDIDISQQMLQDFEGIFHLLPDYVRSSISAEDKEHISAIEKKLLDLNSIIGDEENITIDHEETLKDTFHEIIARKIKLLKGKFDQQSVQLWGEAEISEISSTLNNIIFWSNILKLNQVVDAVDVLKKLLLTPHRQSLAEDDLASIIEFMDFMAEEYASADEQLWVSSTKGLRDILAFLQEAAPEAVPISEATKAFEDVTIQQIVQVIKSISNSQVRSEELFENVIPHFFEQLNENATLMEIDHLKGATQKAIDLANNINQYIPKMESTERERFEYFLEGILRQFRQSSYPIEFNELLKYLEELQSRLESGEKAGPEVETEQEPEETEAISDEEIQTVFREETHKYVERIEDIITQMESEYSEESWQQMGITVHTLKGSAQMLGRKDVSELAALLEEISGLVQQGKAPRGGEVFSVIKDVVDSIKASVGDPSHYKDEKRERFQKRIQSLTTSQEEEEEKPTEEKSEVASDEIDFSVEEELTVKEEEHEIVELVEQDPEMLEIFNEEVSNNIELVEKHLDNIEKFAYDKALMQEIDRSIHEICSAAKMLGLSEIGDLSEKLERLADLIYQQKIDNVKSTIPLMRRAMLVIRELTLNRQIEQHFLEEVRGQIESLLGGETYQVVPEEKPEQPPAKEELPEGLTPQVWEAFFQEAVELIDDINYLILELEKGPDNRELRHHLMRSLHTLKGSAAMVNAKKIETLAHSSEGLLEALSKQNLALDTKIFDLLFEVVDETKYILNALKTFQQEKTQKFDEIEDKLSRFGEGEDISSQEAVGRPLISESQEVESSKEEKIEKTSKEIPTTEKTYIRLNIDQMNHLLNLAAEMVVSHTQFKNQLDRLKNMSPALDSELKLFEETKEHLDSILKLEQRIQDTLSSTNEVQPGLKESVKNQLVNITKILDKFQAFQQEIDSLSHSLRDNSETYDENIQKLNKLSNELLDEIIQARLVPIQLLFKRFHRPVRDITHQFNKKINLVIRGEDTELDRSLVEELYNPLIHIIRNAIDHGIETPEERNAAGKDPEGLLEILASRDRNQVDIEIHDDGSGIDIENVKKSALERELISEKDLENMSEQDVFDLLFYPGFSTLSEATLVSGRGVGLDAVKTEIERIKGDIRIYSEKGKGTTVVIRVPISLSVIQSMLVNVSGHVYSIPLNQVEETLNIDAREVLKKEKDYFLRYKTKEIPLVFLSQLLVLQKERQSEMSLQNKNPVIITFDRGNYVALLVDKIVRREEILIKSLGPSLKRLKYIIGGSIMADGRIVLVLDIPQIIQDTLKTTMAAAQVEKPTVARPRTAMKKTPVSTKKGARKVIEDRKPIILIVDDSLSVRKYVSGLLSEWGFMAETAKNGYEALKLLKGKNYDLMVTDLEMPQISGYELIESTRNDIKLQDIPIIVLTGRASEDFRKRTTELGADAYIIKPFKDQELLDEINKFIRYEKE